MDAQFHPSVKMYRSLAILLSPLLCQERCSRLVPPAAVPQVTASLRMRFGRPKLLITAVLLGWCVKLRFLDRTNWKDLWTCRLSYASVANDRAHLPNPQSMDSPGTGGDASLGPTVDEGVGYTRRCQEVDLKTLWCSVAHGRPKNTESVNSQGKDSSEEILRSDREVKADQLCSL